MTDGRVSKQQDEQNPSLGPAEKAGEQGARAGFERWAFDRGWRNFTRDEHSGAYVVEGGLELRWIGWRACALASEAPAETPAASEAPAEHPWRCFHCGDVFHDAQAAEEHFGRSEYQEPVCKVDATKYREMEERVRRCNEEDTDLHRQIARMESDHRIALQREEEAGYAKGLADGRAETASAPLVLPEPAKAALMAADKMLDALYLEVMTEERMGTAVFHETRRLVKAALATPLSPKQESRS